MSRNQRLALLALAVVVVVAGFVIVKPGSDDGGGSTSAQTTTTVVDVATDPSKDGATQRQTETKTVVEKPAAPKIPTIVVEDGKPVGGVRTLNYDKGDEIDFKVRANAPGGEVHFHGYDVHEMIPADGGTVRFTLPAKFDGIFVVELEATGEEIASVEVQP